MAKLKLTYEWWPMAKFLTEAMAATNFTATDYAVLLVVLRMTYGEPHPEVPGERLTRAAISLNDIAVRTGRNLSGIRRSVKALEDANVIRTFGQAGPREGRVFALNAKIDTWKIRRSGVVLEGSYPGGPPPKRRKKSGGGRG